MAKTQPIQEKRTIRSLFETALAARLHGLPLHLKNIATLSQLLRSQSLGQSGVAALEFAILVPVLILLVIGGIQFGLTVNNYAALTSATRAGARQLALSRGDATPMTDTQNQVYGAAPNLTQASLTISLSVNGTACTSDSSCSAALTSGVPATVTISYPCSLQIGGTNFAPSCTLSAKTTERVE